MRPRLALPLCGLRFARLAALGRPRAHPDASNGPSRLYIIAAESNKNGQTLEDERGACLGVRPEKVGEGLIFEVNALDLFVRRVRGREAVVGSEEEEEQDNNTQHKAGCRCRCRWRLEVEVEEERERDRWHFLARCTMAVDPSQLSATLAQAALLKDQAAESFRAQDYKRAARLYHMVCYRTGRVRRNGG
jgi:hypothetical protein